MNRFCQWQKCVLHDSILGKKGWGNIVLADDAAAVISNTCMVKLAKYGT